MRLAPAPAAAREPGGGDDIEWTAADTAAMRAANAPESPLDAVIVPGGGLDERGEPWPWVKARLDAALRHDATTRQYLVLSRGTTHKPAPTDADGFAVDESVASARYLSRAALIRGASCRTRGASTRSATSRSRG